MGFIDASEISHQVSRLNLSESHPLYLSTGLVLLSKKNDQKICSFEGFSPCCLFTTSSSTS